MKKATNERAAIDTEKPTLRDQPLQRDAHAKPTTKAQRMLSLGAASPANPRAVRQPLPTPKPNTGATPTRLEASIMTGGNIARRMPAGTPGLATLPPERTTKNATERPAYFPPDSQPKANKIHHTETKAAETARPGVRKRLGELRSLLAEGWEIMQPIFARPLWASADETATAYNFVLCRAQATRLVTVPDTASVTRFIRTRQLVVDVR